MNLGDIQPDGKIRLSSKNVFILMNKCVYFVWLFASACQSNVHMFTFHTFTVEDHQEASLHFLWNKEWIHFVGINWFRKIIWSFQCSSSVIWQNCPADFWIPPSHPGREAVSVLYHPYAVNHLAILENREKKNYQFTFQYPSFSFHVARLSFR